MVLGGFHCHRQLSPGLLVSPSITAQAGRGKGNRFLSHETNFQSEVTHSLLFITLSFCPLSKTLFYAYSHHIP